jgi:nicotinamidase-related amidase
VSAAREGGDLLVVVDMQEVFRAGPWEVAGLDAIVPAVDELARGFGPLVLFSRFVAPAEPEGSWVDYYRVWDFATRPESAPLWELVEPFRARRPPTLDLPTFSKWGPELRRALEPAGGLVLCGAATDCCVLATALGAVDAGVPVRVVEDACAGVSREAHERALALLAGFAPQLALTSVAEERRAPAPA